MKRSEIIFLYDIANANPNGDPADENKPRIDEETGYNIVTDVRLKRTVRDYLHDFKKEEIFVREIADEQDNIQDAKMRARDFIDEDKRKKFKDIEISEGKKIVFDAVRKSCIDIRLFGATIPLEFKKSGSIQITGPVQFKMGRSLHKVNMMHIKGTGAFASEAGKGQKTFREEYFLSYALIGFYGIINEKSAEYSGMQDKDADLLLDGIWNGTKNLITRSKVGQVPRLLLQIEYKDSLFHIGDLDKKITAKNEIRDEEIRDIKEIPLDITALKNTLSQKKDSIERIRYKADERLVLLENGAPHSFKEIMGKDITLSELTF